MRNKITTKEVPNFSRMRRPLITDNADTLKFRAIRSLPIIEHVIDNTVESLLWRVPRLHQIVINVRVIDRADRGVDIRVSGEQRPLRMRIHFDCLLQKLHARHPWHSLIDEKKSNRFVAELQLFGRFERGDAGIGGDHSVAVAIVMAQVSLDGAQHVRVVVHGPDDGFDHNPNTSGSRYYLFAALSKAACKDS